VAFLAVFSAKKQLQIAFSEFRRFRENYARACARGVADDRPRVDAPLHLSREGRRMLRKVMDVSAAHEAELCAGLDASERKQLIALLSRLAAEHGLYRRPSSVAEGNAERTAGE
jgi:hypothetical protein